MLVSLLIWGGVLAGGLGFLVPWKWLTPVGLIVAGLVGLITSVGVV